MLTMKNGCVDECVSVMQPAGVIVESEKCLIDGISDL